MQQLGVGDRKEVSVVERPDGRFPATAASSYEEPPGWRVEDVFDRSERRELRAEVQRLEAELERYRAHAERTSKLFLSATKYAEWIRESARQDAELALRNARVRVERIEATLRQVAWTENELVRQQDELARLDALTDETRTRLSALLTDGLQALDMDVQAVHEDGPEPALEDHENALYRELASTSARTSGSLGAYDAQER